MRVAVCGYPTLALQIQEHFCNSSIEFKFFISDFVSTRGEETNNFVTNLPTINFFEFKWLVNANELDGVIIAEDVHTDFTKNIVRIFKFYKIPQVGVMDLIFFNPLAPIQWLEVKKNFLPYLEADITDACNLKCKACYHFANFSLKEEFYPLEIFRQDIRQVARICDILTFRLLGGEPFILKNIDKYIEVVRYSLPKATLRILSNGLLIPALPQKIFDSLRENKMLP